MKWKSAILHNLKEYRDKNEDWPDPDLSDISKTDRELMVMRAEKNEMTCIDLWREYMLKFFPVAYAHHTAFAGRPDMSKCAFKPANIRKWKLSKKVS